MNELELYIHIPFCMKKCNYCDFLSAPADEESQSAYMEGLKREIAFYGKRLRGKRVSTVYIGGGTPSWMQQFYIEELMEAVYASFLVEDDAEITIECNPGTLTGKKLECYKKQGINRLSIGLQSADDEELKLLGRVHTYDQFLRNYELARECGFDNINIDLMDSLPGHTVEKFYQTLMRVIRLKPEHISCYSLIIEKGTPFYDRYKFDVVKLYAGMQTEELPMEDTSYQIGKMTQDLLAEYGYIRYEISNYAKEGYACRHNIGYWQRKEYLGVGLGSASLLEETRYSNLRDLWNYIEISARMEGNTVYDESLKRTVYSTNLHESVSGLSREEQMEEFMFLGLRMPEGILKSRFYQNFGFPVSFIYKDVLPKLKQENLLVETPTRIYLTDKGMDLNSYVAAQFLL